MAKRLIFLLGGARSGKSHYAEEWAKTQGKRVLFVATAEARDEEMQARIAAHREQRPDDWHTLEAARNVAQQVADCAFEYDTVLIDCLTLLTSNILLDLSESTGQAEANEAAVREIDELLAVIDGSDATWLLVSNEVGMGVVPPTKLGRLFQDMLGRVNQRIAERADEVLLLVAGLPWKLK